MSPDEVLPKRFDAFTNPGFAWRAEPVEPIASAFGRNAAAAWGAPPADE